MKLGINLGTSGVRTPPPLLHSEFYNKRSTLYLLWRYVRHCYPSIAWYMKKYNVRLRL